MGSTNDMINDINNFAKIWDDAQAAGIFDDAPKPPQPRQEEETDFFGNYLTDDYDMDKPLNEVCTEYWAKVSEAAEKRVQPITEGAITASKENIKVVADKVGSAHNPIQPGSISKDQDVDVTQNWAVGGKEYFQLEELKVKLEKLECKLNALTAEGDSGKGVQSKIDSLKKQIDDLSDSLDGNRWSEYDD